MSEFQEFIQAVQEPLQEELNLKDQENSQLRNELNQSKNENQILRQRIAELEMKK